MHYGNLVIVRLEDAEADLDAAIEKAMGPSEENGGFWDGGSGHCPPGERTPR